MFSHILLIQQTPVRIFKYCQDLPESIHQINTLSLTGIVRHSLLDAFAVRMCFKRLRSKRSGGALACGQYSVTICNFTPHDFRVEQNSWDVKKRGIVRLNFVGVTMCGKHRIKPG